MLTGAKQILAHRTQKKEPITPVIFEQLVSKSPGKEAPLSDIHIVTVCLIGFAGFLRLNEMDNLKESDVQVFDEHMELFIESSKTDQSVFLQGLFGVVPPLGLSDAPIG